MIIPEIRWCYQVTKVIFGKLRKGEEFVHGGNVWAKRSTRTGVIVKPNHLYGSWFYFSKNEYVEEFEKC